MAAATKSVPRSSIGINNHGFDDGDGGVDVFQASDQYLLFYRYHGCNGGEGRFFAGCNANSDGLLGADMLIPVGDRFSVTGGFEYLIPERAKWRRRRQQEAWNIGLGLVWHWDCQARKCFTTATARCLTWPTTARSSSIS